jgi:hypothetical protein
MAFKTFSSLYSSEPIEGGFRTKLVSRQECGSYEIRRLIPRIGVIPVLDYEDGPAAEYFDEKTGQKMSQWRREGLLHRLDGPCVVSDIQDSMYRWWGVDIPPVWVEQPPSPTDILKVKNAEQRQVAIRATGADKFVHAVATKVIDVDQGVAFRVMVEDPHKDRWIIATDGSTGRTYVMYAEQHKTIRDALVAMGHNPDKTISEG